MYATLRLVLLSSSLSPLQLIYEEYNDNNPTENVVKPNFYSEDASESILFKPGVTPSTFPLRKLTSVPRWALELA